MPIATPFSFAILTSFPRSLSKNRAFGVYAYLVKVEAFPKNKHSHMFDIGVKLTCEHCFWEITMNLGR
jgi:hypothetical protein